MTIGWPSSLSLGFRHQADRQRTLLSQRQHRGGLVVQKALYPEPEPQRGICHALVLYTPAGIAGGDHLQLDFNLAAQSHAVITTPGAGKWYGCADSQQVNLPASQRITGHVSEKAILEWLPQETIFYRGSHSYALNHFYLTSSSCLIAWDMNVLGRRAYQEAFTAGQIVNEWQIWRDDTLIAYERFDEVASSEWFKSVIGLRSQPVFGTLWAVPPDDLVPLNDRTAFLDQTVDAIRGLCDLKQLGIICTHNFVAISCRYLGDDVRYGFEGLYQVRELLRERWLKLLPHRPRIWDT